VDTNSGGTILPAGAEGTWYYGKDTQYCSKSKSSADPKNGAGCTIKALTDKDYFKNLPR